MSELVVSELVPILALEGYTDKQTRRPGQRRGMPPGELVAMLTTHSMLSDKFAGHGYSPVTMVDEPCTCGKDTCPRDLGHFIANNVVAVHLIVVDLDKYRSDDRQLDQAGAERTLDKLRESGLWHIVHSTHSHRYPDHASFRAVFRPARAVLPVEMDPLLAELCAVLDIDADLTCSKTLARFWFLPARAPDAEPIGYAVDGAAIDVDALIARARTRQASTPVAEPRKPYTPRGDEFDIVTAMATSYPGIKQRKDSNTGEIVWLIGGARCPNAAAHTSPNGRTDTTVWMEPSGRWGCSCLHSHCKGKIGHDDFRQHIQPDWKPYDPSAPRTAKRNDAPVPSTEHPNAPHVNGHAVSSEVIAARLHARERPVAPEPDDVAEAEAVRHYDGIAETPPPGPDVPPADTPDDASGDDSPNAPWRGGEKGPAALAFAYVAKYAGHADGPTLRKWRGDFYSWISEFGCYRKCTDDQIVSAIQRRLKIGDPAVARDVRAALIAVDDVLGDDVELGEWIGKPTVSAPALELAPVRNGLLHLRTGVLYDATPRFFHTAALGVTYDSKAPPPVEWFKFLGQLWPNDPESVIALQDWIGYLLTPDTSFHKIMLIVGPKRTGKGTIARVINALLGGKDSVVSPTLASLGQNFGLAPLIGKIAAIVGDARLGGRTDVPQVVERLLNLSGEDAQSVDRKHRDAWHGQLMARFMIISNEPPKFTDASDALPARMIALELLHSFYGKEDRTLTDRLVGLRGHRGELPGILRWAMEGWRRLQDRGHFVQPASSAHLIEDLEDLASPVKAWARERCEQGPTRKADCKAAFADFQRWCAEDAHQKHVVTATRFGIDLRTAAQVKRVQKAGGHDYHGIELRPEPEHWIKPVPPPGDGDRPHWADK